jgi:hypothetical protein
LHLFELAARSSLDDAEDVVAFVDTIAAAAGRSLELEMAVEKDAERGIGGDVERDRDEVPCATD